MVDCRWLKPVLVAQFEFVEWTEDAHLRHSRFVGLREDKTPEEIVRENSRKFIWANEAHIESDTSIRLPTRDEELFAVVRHQP